MWSGIGLEFSSRFKKKTGFTSKAFSCSLQVPLPSVQPRRESWNLKSCSMDVSLDGISGRARLWLGFLAVLLVLPVFWSPCTVSLPGTNFKGRLRMEPYCGVGSALEIFPVHPIFHMHCVCRCCLYVTHTLLFFREGSRSWNHLLATAKGCSARWVSSTGDSGMNKGVLVDVWEEEVSVQKLLRRLQEMTNWRDRKAIVGKMPVSMDVSLSC